MPTDQSDGAVIAVHRAPEHGFSKHSQTRIRLIEGQGVEGDAHCGVRVKHRSRVAQNPDQPNLRQVHLLPAELFDTLADAGFEIAAGQLGENITTRGIDLLALPVDTLLQIGSARIRLTGLRNPCNQIEHFRPGLLAQLRERGADGHWIRKAGVMGVVDAGGEVAPGDRIRIAFPPAPYRAMDRV